MPRECTHQRPALPPSGSSCRLTPACMRWHSQAALQMPLCGARWPRRAAHLRTRGSKLLRRDDADDAQACGAGTDSCHEHLEHNEALHQHLGAPGPAVSDTRRQSLVSVVCTAPAPRCAARRRRTWSTMASGWKTRDLSKATPKTRPQAPASAHCAATGSGLESDISAGRAWLRGRKKWRSAGLRRWAYRQKRASVPKENLVAVITTDHGAKRGA